MSMYTVYKCTVRRPGYFHVKKLSYDKFLCLKVFVGMTPYLANINDAH